MNRLQYHFTIKLDITKKNTGFGLNSLFLENVLNASLYMSRNTFLTVILVLQEMTMKFAFYDIKLQLCKNSDKIILFSIR